MRVRWGAVIAALSIVAVAACGDDGGGVTDTPDEPDEPTELTADEWVTEADAICTEFRADIADLDTPSGDPTSINTTDRELTQFADYLDAVVPLLQDAAERTAALGAPPELATDIESLTDLRAASIVATQDAAAAAREGDNLSFRSAWNEITENEAEIDGVSQQLGLQVCGQDGGTTGETVPLDEWTSSVLTICEARSEELGAVTEPSADAENVTEADLPEVAAYFTQLSEIYSASVDEIAAVGIPEGAEADGTAFLDGERALADALDAVAVAADSGDLDAFDTAFDDLITTTVDLESIGQDLGVEACAA